MQKIELSYDNEVYCPFCGKLLIGDYDEVEFESCEHVLFIGCSEGFHYIREDVKLEPEYEDYEQLDAAIDALEIKNSLALVLDPDFPLAGTVGYIGFQAK